VNLQEIKIGGEPVDLRISFGSVIVDSGTTSTYLPTAIEGTFAQTFSKVTGKDFYNLNYPNPTACLDDKLPDITFTFKNDVTVAMPCTAYLDCWEGECTPSIFFEGGTGAVLGASFMKGHDVVFDWENNQVGFANADCLALHGAT